MPSTMPFPSIDASNLPAGYNNMGVLFPADTDYSPSPIMIGSSANITSNGNDMYQWLAFHMGLASSDWQLLEAMQSPTYTANNACSGTINPTVSRGWFFPQVASGDTAYVTKNGAVRGYSSYIAFQDWMGTANASPTGVFVLTNSNYNGGATGLGSRFIKMLLNNSALGAENDDSYYLPGA